MHGPSIAGGLEQYYSHWFLKSRLLDGSDLLQNIVLMPAKNFCVLTMLTTLRPGYLIFKLLTIMFVNCFKLQMAQIILLVASGALDSPHNAAHRWDFCRMQQGMTMLIWATNYDDVIMSKRNTNDRPRKMFTPCLHSTDAWNSLGYALHKVSIVYFVKPPRRVHKACCYTAAEWSWNGVPGRLSSWVNRASCRQLCMHLSCTIYISDNSPDIF